MIYDPSFFFNLFLLLSLLFLLLLPGWEIGGRKVCERGTTIGKKVGKEREKK
jgi:hypothetical protein